MVKAKYGSLEYHKERAEFYKKMAEKIKKANLKMAIKRKKAKGGKK